MIWLIVKNTTTNQSNHGKNGISLTLQHYNTIGIIGRSYMCDTRTKGASQNSPKHHGAVVKRLFFVYCVDLMFLLEQMSRGSN